MVSGSSELRPDCINFHGAILQKVDLAKGERFVIGSGVPHGPRKTVDQAS